MSVFLYLSVLTLKYDFIKYDKYAFEKYNLFENTSTIFVKYDSSKGKYAHT